MYVEEVSALFLQLCDEQDTTYMTPAQRQLYLKQAYEAFRDEVAGIDAFFFTESTTITLADQSSYPLSLAPTVIMGPNAAVATRLERLLRVFIINDAGEEIGALSRVGEVKEIRPTYDGAFGTTGQYLLRGRTLMFDRKFTCTMRLLYMPSQSVDWTKETPGDNEYIDDLNEWHDIIARLALKQYYQVRDGAVNEVNEMVLQDRIGKFRNFLNGGWMQDGANVIFDAYLNNG